MSLRDEYIKNNSVDAEWFLALKKIKRPLLLHSYTIPAKVLEDEKQKVLQDSSYNPVFEYQNLNGSAVRESQYNLLNLREKVWQEESNQSIREAYVDKINEALLIVRMLLATEEKRWDEFSLCNQEKYGDVSTKIINEKILWLQEKRNLFQDIDVELTETNTPPSPETIAVAKNVFSNGPTISGTKTFYEAEEISHLWQSEISKFAMGWKVVVGDSNLHLIVNSRLRIVSIPKHARMSELKMRSLFIHEVGTHIYRRELGKKTKLQLLSIGLAGYQKAEEGIAIVREQLINERYNRYGGFDKYLALSYALGAVDGQMKDFQQTFTMLRAYYAMRLTKKHIKEDVERIALDRAWGSTVRIFRGGQPSLPGCCLRRDKIYREGSMYIWDLLQKSPEYFKNVYIGKYDPGNEKHRNLVSEFK